MHIAKDLNATFNGKLRLRLGIWPFAWCNHNPWITPATPSCLWIFSVMCGLTLNVTYIFLSSIVLPYCCLKLLVNQGVMVNNALWQLELIHHHSQSKSVLLFWRQGDTRNSITTLQYIVSLLACTFFSLHCKGEPHTQVEHYLSISTVYKF